MTGDATALRALRDAAEQLGPQLVDWRRAIHRNPELAFEERETARMVAAHLESLGLEVRRGVGETGVLALLPGRSDRPAVLLRADMDALPIQEVAGRPYGSTVAGRMHACGHDAHTAMLMGAAAILANAPPPERPVLFCFQPAEEGGGGAPRMIREGALDWVPVGSAYALHVWSLLEAGTLHLRPGPIMAAQDEFHVEITGRGGHGALPHRAVDPVVAGAAAVASLQAVVAREVDPLEPAVLTVGRFHAGTAPNVIPATAHLSGTLRSFDSGVRRHLRRRVREVLEAVARAHRCRARVDLVEGYPAVVNDPSAAREAAAVAAALLGGDRVAEARPLMAAEDFAYFLQRVPGVFALLGAGNEARGITAPHHSADFDLDESVLPLGAALLAAWARWAP